MTLRKKLLWLFVPPLTLTLGLVYVLSQTMMLERLDREDELLLVNEAKRLRALMSNSIGFDLDRLQRLAQQMSPEHPTQAVEPATLEQLNFDFLLQLDATGTLQLDQWRPIDLASRPLLLTSERVDLTHLRSSIHQRAAQLSKNNAAQTSQVELVVLEGVPLILASVTSAQHPAQPSRTLVAGHLLDASRLNALQTELKGNLRVVPASQYSASETALNRPRAEDQEQISLSSRHLPDERHQQIALLFSHSPDEQQLVLELTRERRLYNEGRKAINLFLVVSTAVVLLAWLLIYLGLEFLLLRRVSRMHDEFARIGPDVSSRLSDSGADELGYLAQEANQTLERLEQSEARDRAILEAIEEGYFELNIKGEIVSVNRAFCQLLGYESQSPVGIRVQTLLDEDANQRFLTLINSIDGNSSQVMSGRLRRVDGSLCHYETRLSTILDAQGRIRGYRGILHDVSRHVEYQSQLLDIAYRDALTGLGNRKAFYEHLQQRINEAPAALALLFIDLDRFKQVNDSFGHDVGDALLVQMAQRLRSAVRKPDQAYRLGGDEFTLILSADAAGAQGLAQRLLAKLGQPVTLDSLQIDFVTPSIGIAVYPQHAQDIDSLIKAADQAMYQAKRGRNEAVLFSAAY
ncbi:diguanylate cyclase domain-containing protein [Pseudomonas sp. UM16]|uniref:diguanylate cyclase domain-containing protein n=1 Tax=Pseudomonas sp. UM16 TaxID=3158962 RepID=UPI003990283C